MSVYEPVNGVRLSVGDFQDLVKEPICFTVPFTAHAQKGYGLLLNWYGKADIVIDRIEMVPVSDEATVGLYMNAIWARTPLLQSPRSSGYSRATV